MAFPDYNDKAQGTPIVYGEVLASGVTHPITIDGLAAGAARMGASADLGVAASGGSFFADAYAVSLKVELNSSGIHSSGTIDLYLVSSHDNSNWGGRVTGSDGAYTFGSTGLALAGDPVIQLTPPASSGITIIQAPVLWEPKGRYVVPILVNNTNKALKDEASSSAHDSRIFLVPIRKATID